VLEDRTLPSAGALDLSFGSNGKVTTAISASGGDSAQAVALQADGKILAAGISSGGFALVRYTPSGLLDSNFGTGGVVTTSFGTSAAEAEAMAVQPDGKIILAGFASGGSTTRFALARYLPGGALDPGFGTGGLVLTAFGTGSAAANALALQPDGRIVVAGAVENGSALDFALARYLPDGSLDADFDADGRVVTDFGLADGASSVLVRPDGTIVAAGHSGPYFALSRYLPDGELDTSFGTGGKVRTTAGPNANISGLVLQADGTLLAAGSSSDGSGSDFVLARYLADGSLDPTFASGGMVTTDFAASTDFAQGLAVESDGRIVVAGCSDAGGSSLNFALARYLPDGTLDTDFSSDGKVLTDFNASFDRANALAIQRDGQIVVAGIAHQASPSILTV
jgi:uncharacterized delta-60 repeat protein